MWLPNSSPPISFSLQPLPPSCFHPVGGKRTSISLIMGSKAVWGEAFDWENSMKATCPPTPGLHGNSQPLVFSRKQRKMQVSVWPLQCIADVDKSSDHTEFPVPSAHGKEILSHVLNSAQNWSLTHCCTCCSIYVCNMQNTDPD